MKNGIDSPINSGDGQYKTAISEINRFRQEIASNELIQHLKNNPLDSNVQFEQVLVNALDEMESNLAV